jgi:hypothetical protein
MAGACAGGREAIEEKAVEAMYLTENPTDRYFENEETGSICRAGSKDLPYIIYEKVLEEKGGSWTLKDEKRGLEVILLAEAQSGEIEETSYPIVERSLEAIYIILDNHRGRGLILSYRNNPTEAGNSNQKYGSHPLLRRVDGEMKFSEAEVYDDSRARIICGSEQECIFKVRRAEEILRMTCELMEKAEREEKLNIGTDIKGKQKIWL